MTDPTIFVGATVTIIGSLTVAIVTIINAVGNMKKELIAKADRNAESLAEVKTKVDGNFSDVKSELVNANQRIAVLTERLLTTTTTEKP